MYIAPPVVIPGTGTLKIDKLNSDQLTEKTEIEGKKAILHGSQFDAVFEVQSPAQQPTPTGPVQDSMTKYSGGRGMFVPTNAKVLAKWLPRSWFLCWESTLLWVLGVLYEGM